MANSPRIGGVRYTPMEQMYDRRNEGDEAWAQRIRATPPEVDAELLADEALLLDAQIVPVLELPGHEPMLNRRPRKTKEKR